jgi:hypothetical protein
MSVALAALTAGSAPAAGEEESEFGCHVATHAQLHLVESENPPTVTCEHDGHVHTFATFGAPVEHMLANDGEPPPRTFDPRSDV